MTQVITTQTSPFSRRWIITIIAATILAVFAIVALKWIPAAQRLLGGSSSSQAIKADDQGKEDPHGNAAHAGHDHAGHKEENSLELSEQARRSIGLKAGKVELTNFEKTANIPGMVVERRGRSRVTITAPLTGVVTRVYVTEGEAVVPDQLLFEMRLTHEELVQSQADLLRTVEELDVVRREVARIEKVVADGAIPGKVLLDRLYEQQKQEAVLRSQKQALLLHGLSEAQVTNILETRKLLNKLEVRVPPISDAQQSTTIPIVFQVQEIRAELGQQVMAGIELAILSNYTELLIEGEAFEQDASAVADALAADRPLSAVLETKENENIEINGLHIAYQANRIDPTSRAMHFYVGLPNKLTRDTGKSEGRRFIDWAYKPGQRTTLRLPVEQWKDRIVLPVEAVAQDGVESYVFRANGDHFDRQPVQVEFRDPINVVIANDGSLFPGETIAFSGAQQMQLALKNKAGGGVDPHAGHNH